MNKISGKVLLLLVLSLVFAGCAQRKEVQLREERSSHLELQKSALNLTDKVDEQEELDGLEIIEDEEENLVNPPSMAEMDTLKAPEAVKAPETVKVQEETIKAKPIILASTGTFSSKRKNQSQKEDYEEAYSLYKGRDFMGAISAFSSFIVKYPSTSYTDNAFYWRGECYYAMGKFSKAIDEFDAVKNKFPQGNKVPDALLKKGYSYIKIQNISKAKSSLQKIIDLYPFSSAAKKAAKKINSL